MLAYLRRDDERCVLIVANLSRHAQYVELDLSRFRGLAPVEMFGQTRFPPIGDLPYLLTLGPHAVYWLAIEEPQDAPVARSDGGPRRSGKPVDIGALATGRDRAQLERALVDFLPTRRWIADKTRTNR